MTLRIGPASIDVKEGFSPELLRQIVRSLETLMLTLPKKVYLAGGSTDLRKSIDGLAALVQESFQLDPFGPCLFVFCNRQRDKLKMLYWEHNGFWLLYCRLERGTFQWPGPDNPSVAVSFRELRWLLDGLALYQRQAHKQVTAQTVV